MYFVIILLLLVAVLFAIDLIRPDLIALFALCMLIFGGILTADEALSAFGNTTVVMVATLFIIGKGLSTTGITQAIGNNISLRIKTGQQNLLISVIMGTVGSIGAFMSSTGIVALFVPVVKRIATINNFNIKNLLMPLAYAGLISGMMTLISTAPNLIVSEELSNQGYEPFNMLDFTPIGISMLIAAILYFRFKGYFTKNKETEVVNLGSERMKSLLKKYNIDGEIFRLLITKDSPYLNWTVSDTNLRKHYNINILGIEAGEGFANSMTVVRKDTILRLGQILYVNGFSKDIENVCSDKKLQLLAYKGVHSSLLKQQIGLAELVIPFNSGFIDETIESVGAKRFTQFNILGSKRLKSYSLNNLKKHQVKTGESLLILGSRDDIAELNNNNNDYIVFNIPFEHNTKINSRKATTAIVITVAMIVMLVINFIPPVLTILAAALLMVTTKCLSMEQAYQSINWSTIVLIAAMLPFASALEKTGGINLIVDSVISIFGKGSPYLLLAGLFIATVLFGSFLSNTATAVIFAPIGIKIAEASSISPYPVAMTIAIAASSAFLTPIASPVNMLVVSPGNYKFRDFVVTGLPMFVIALIISLLIIPAIFPF
jgi:di/tricarboxylate transporter